MLDVHNNINIFTCISLLKINGVVPLQPLALLLHRDNQTISLQEQPFIGKRFLSPRKVMALLNCFKFLNFKAISLMKCKFRYWWIPRCTDPESCKREIAEDFEHERPVWELTCYGHCKGYVFYPGPDELGLNLPSSFTY